MNKDIKEIIRDLQTDGWTLKSQNKHIKMQSPSGNILCFSVSPSCQFAARKIRRDAQRIMKEERSEMALA